MVGFKVTLNLPCLTIKIECRRWTDLHLSMIGGHHEQGMLHFAGERLIKLLLHRAQKHIDRLLKLL